MRQDKCCLCNKEGWVNWCEWNPNYPHRGYKAGEICAKCYDELGILSSTSSSGLAGRKEDGPSPGQENAIRAWEDG